MAKRRKRRKWSDDEKRMICGQTRLPGISVAQVARRYDVNANQAFNWLKDPRFAAKLNDEVPSCFLPVEVVEPMRPEPATSTDHGEMVVDVASGHRLKITGSYDPDALSALIRKLST
ncbi:MAG: transposase [Pseudomonadota bacterium]